MYPVNLYDQSHRHTHTHMHILYIYMSMIVETCSACRPAENSAGAIRFVGSTEFADGEWFGVELEKPLGKKRASLQSRARCYGEGVKPSFKELLGGLNDSRNRIVVTKT